tara:strand:- start:635 stop:1243 length:609 start_codon:yes stop_codon:yes gene_type:complete
MDFILDLDESLFIFLNSLGSEYFDDFWLYITAKESWVWLYIFSLILLLTGKKKENFIPIGFSFYDIKPTYRNWFSFLLGIILLIVFTDQSSNIFKDYFQRLRPCHDPDLIGFFRPVKEICGGLYGFFSAHAANSFAFATFIFFMTKKNYRNLSLVLFIWATVVSYSRIYIGVHFPSDVIFGAIYGISAGLLFYKLSLFFFKN